MADEKSENPIAECTVFLAQQFEGAITSVVGGLIEKMKKEPVWANSILTGIQQFEIAAPMDPASTLLVYQSILATCKEFGVCRRCNGKEKVRSDGAKVPCPVCAVIPKGPASVGDGSNGNGQAEAAASAEGEGRLRAGGDHRGGDADEGGKGPDVIVP